MSHFKFILVKVQVPTDQITETPFSFGAIILSQAKLP